MYKMIELHFPTARLPFVRYNIDRIDLTGLFQGFQNEILLSYTLVCSPAGQGAVKVIRHFDPQARDRRAGGNFCARLRPLPSFEARQRAPLAPSLRLFSSTTASSTPPFGRIALRSKSFTRRRQLVTDWWQIRPALCH